MQFRLRALFIAVAVIAIPCAVAALLEHEWFGPARIYADAQSKCDKIFADNGWQGYVMAFHYDYRVRITSPNINDGTIKHLIPVLREIAGLRHIELYATSMSEDGVEKMKREFPDCYFTVYDQRF